MGRIHLVTLIACAGLVRAEILFRDSFEEEGGVRWRSTWGKAERSQEKAHSGEWGVKESPENKHGLSVWYTEFPAYPKATYRARAWVFVPEQENAPAAALSFNQLTWNSLAVASTDQRGEWVQLAVELHNETETRLRLQLFQRGQGAGIGGSVMYWDDVVVERELGELALDDGMRINPHVKQGLDVTPDGGTSVRVAAGTINVDGVLVDVPEGMAVRLEPPRRVEVRDEAAQLTDQEPQGYGTGTPLKGCRPQGVTIAGALDPTSLVVKSAKGADAPRLEEGEDWRADKAWARLGRLDGGKVGPDTVVHIDYAYSLMRIDTIAVRSDGKVIVRQGSEHITCPQPPRPDMRARALCNVFLQYHCTEITPELIYPIGPPFPAPTQAETQRKASLIPRTITRLKEGGDLTLLFWGDSVTCGGDASSLEKAFPRAFTAWLRDRYPQANITYVNAGTGGWNSASKLPLFQEEVIDKGPDLVVIEFVNDMGFDRDRVFRNYAEAVSRIRECGGEVIILTPHFVRPDWMRGDGMRTPEVRPAVTYLKEFAEENGVGLADASRRWAHLWVEGLPYLTLLYNAINHPDDRGHRLFVEELQTFFP